MVIFRNCTVGLIALTLIACSDSSTVTSYKLKKIDPEYRNHFGWEWSRLNPSSFKVSGNTVTQLTGGFVWEHDNCQVFTVNDWECQYSDASGSFGYRDGKYWEYPIDESRKIVSRLHYARVSCEQNLQDQGLFFGAIVCVIGLFTL